MRILLALITMVTVIATFGDAMSETDTSTKDGYVVAELFTSQSCSSCPPAEDYFASLADRENLIVIEWHVDYWNRLVHGRVGAWVDPFSNAKHTERQIEYNLALRNTTGVYTPQAIVGGQLEGVGSRQPDIEALLAKTQPTHLAIDISDKRTVSIPAAHLPSETEVRFIRLLKNQATQVRRGENHGRTLASRNIAIASKRLGNYTGQPTSYKLPKLKSNETCVVLVQSTENGIGKVHGAAKC